MIQILLLLVFSCLINNTTIVGVTIPDLSAQVTDASYSLDTVITRNVHPGIIKKIYCHSFRKTRYEVVISGNKIKITSIYHGTMNTVHGIIKGGKIYTDDPVEKTVRSQAGITYVIKGNLFRVKNLENGDYENYELCK
jgi:hypothetical protein